MSRHLRPAEARPTRGPGSDRMGPLAKLPVFLELAGKRAIVAGGSEAAVWKAELLAAAGACVEVFAADPCPALLALVRTHGIRLTHRAWAPGDLSNAAVAIGDFEDADDAVGFVRAARALRIPVNVIDRPGFCDFQFGAIVNRSPVVIGISTDGAAPVLAQAVRRRIEAILPAALGAWGATAHAFRARLAELLPAKGARRRFWEAFVDIAFISQAEEDARLAELEELARTIAEDGHGRTPQRGEVILVGAGPGDPELLTLKAVRALQAADVIVHDRLVTPEILELGRREARRIAVGKHGHGASCRQDDINALLVRLARDGFRVVRLKGGDPSIFGRAGEEIAACRAAGIPVRIVPGVTTALAAAAALETSLTQRDIARRVQFVTGHDRNGRLPDLDFDALSDPRATTCVYMARRTLAELAAKLLRRGLAPETPAALIENVSRPDEQVERTTLGGLARGLSRSPTDAPAIVLIGAALQGSQLGAEAASTEAATGLHAVAG